MDGFYKLRTKISVTEVLNRFAKAKNVVEVVLRIVPKFCSKVPDQAS